MHTLFIILGIMFLFSAGFITGLYCERAMLESIVINAVKDWVTTVLAKHVMLVESDNPTSKEVMDSIIKDFGLNNDIWGKADK